LPVPPLAFDDDVNVGAVPWHTVEAVAAITPPERAGDIVSVNDLGVPLHVPICAVTWNVTTIGALVVFAFAVND
jgi:hypothetical protein